MPATISRVPLTAFDIKGVPAIRRERIEAAVVAGVRHTMGPHEAWIAVDPFNGGFRVLITGPQEFPRRRSRRIGFQIVRISRLGNDQNEFDLAEFPEGAAESTGGMSALWDPPHCAADGSKAGTRSVGRE